MDIIYCSVFANEGFDRRFCPVTVSNQHTVEYGVEKGSLNTVISGSSCRILLLLAVCDRYLRTGKGG
jgi:hypothetical protein